MYFIIPLPDPPLSLACHETDRVAYEGVFELVQFKYDFGQFVMLPAKWCTELDHDSKRKGLQPVKISSHLFPDDEPGFLWS